MCLKTVSDIGEPNYPSSLGIKGRAICGARGKYARIRARSSPEVGRVTLHIVVIGENEPSLDGFSAPRGFCIGLVHSQVPSSVVRTRRGIFFLHYLMKIAFIISCN